MSSKFDDLLADTKFALRVQSLKCQSAFEDSIESAKEALALLLPTLKQGFSWGEENDSGFYFGADQKFSLRVLACPFALHGSVFWLRFRVNYRHFVKHK